MAALSMIIPYPPSASTCGYCSPPGERSKTRSSYKAGSVIAVGPGLSCEVYQKMIDRGWRRSGTYCYKPDLRRSCCPQYTIRLDALEFKPSRSHRKLVHRWNRFILEGDSSDKMDGSQSSKPKVKGANNASFHLISSIHESERSFISDGESVHAFEVTLEPSSYTDEKFALYEKYQAEIHMDFDNAPSGFKRFLVESPLQHERISYPSQRPAHLPETYGSYHQLYRVDGQLIAMGVIDILPGCVSSVYFMYDKRWEKYSLGKLSAMRETALTRELHDAGISGLSSMYMGFYIHSCQKMRYKADYSPSYLADPEEYTWHSLDKCIPLLEENKYVCFSHPEHSIPHGAPIPERPAPPMLSDDELQQINVFMKVEHRQIIVSPMNHSHGWDNVDTRKTVLYNIDALGIELSKEILWFVHSNDGESESE
ncbi:hypothetical protein NEOLEDRAFT_1100325 [Neolentinus lepideus HHB14362 ss-1]|uniref:arginyltransferase n=1 Tax=Neolentinus lepideus HHB14362 ss-1 TaxID=1314782 RepID=A0A165PBY3_9AGAM|nr:hypothetical protein NEOLEDRAFT_1100325 [Neolentinus lepideus HHB14362 ss-1]